MTNDESMCPVCGYDGLLSKAWDDESPSDEICPCCGTHFGYDDVARTVPTRALRYDELRQRWIAADYAWFSRTRTAPPGWNPEAQLRELLNHESMTYRCPACGYPELTEPPRTESGASYEICPSCGFEFGVTDDDLGYTYATWREEWIKLGMPWRSEGIDPVPPGWDPHAQLRTLNETDR